MMIDKTKAVAYGVVLMGCLLFWVTLISILAWGV